MKRRFIKNSMRVFYIIVIFHLFFPILAFSDTIQPLPDATYPSLATMGWVGAQYRDSTKGVLTVDVETQVFGTTNMMVGPAPWSQDTNSGKGYGTSTVSYGSATLYASVFREGSSTRTDLDQYQFVTYAYARFADTMTIFNDALTGQEGSITFDYTLSGTGSKSGSGGAGRVSLWVYSPNYVAYTYALSETDLQSSIGVTETSVSLTTDFIPFKYGEPFSFYTAIGLRPNLIGLEPGSAYFDFSHTLTLSGIDVYDQDDNEVTNYTIQTASGATYPYTAIPEPATLMCLGFGIAVLGFARKR